MVVGGSEGHVHSVAVNDQRRPFWLGWWRGGRVNPALGLGGPQSPALRRQVPWEGPLWGRHRDRVSPQEAGSPIRQLCGEQRCRSR